MPGAALLFLIALANAQAAPAATPSREPVPAPESPTGAAPAPPPARPQPQPYDADWPIEPAEDAPPVTNAEVGDADPSLVAPRPPARPVPRVREPSPPPAHLRRRLDVEDPPGLGLKQVLAGTGTMVGMGALSGLLIFGGVEGNAAPFAILGGLGLVATPTVAAFAVCGVGNSGGAHHADCGGPVLGSYLGLAGGLALGAGTGNDVAVVAGAMIGPALVATLFWHAGKEPVSSRLALDDGLLFRSPIEPPHRSGERVASRSPTAQAAIPIFGASF